MNVVLVMIGSAVIIWSSLVVMLFSILASPMIAWWFKRRKDAEILKSAIDETKKPKKPTSFKVIEADYEIIDKK